MGPEAPDPAALSALEERFLRERPARRALGWSLRWTSPAGPLHVRRLPGFPDEGALARWQALVGAYTAALEARGLAVDAGRVLVLEQGPRRVAYVAHPDEGPSSAGALHEARPAAAMVWLDSLLERLLAVVQPHLGLDADLGRWSTSGGQLRYRGGAEPLLRDASGQERLDPELRLAGLPWPLRPLLRAGVNERLERCYSPRGLMLDLLASLERHSLRGLVPAALERANCALSEPIGAPELAQHHALQERRRAWALRLDAWSGVV